MACLVALSTLLTATGLQAQHRHEVRTETLLSEGARTSAEVIGCSSHRGSRTITVRYGFEDGWTYTVRAGIRPDGGLPCRGSQVEIAYDPDNRTDMVLVDFDESPDLALAFGAWFVAVVVADRFTWRAVRKDSKDRWETWGRMPPRPTRRR